MLGRDARLGSNQILVHNGCGRQGRSNGVCIKHGAMVKRGKPKSLRSSGLRIWILHYIMSDLDVSGFLELLLSPHACHRLLLRFTLAPCWTQTPPCTTCLMHPSWLKRFTLAPCLIQTPPCWTYLPHPSWLQSFSLAPCLIQTPPCQTCLLHPSWLQSLRLRFLAPLSLPCLTPRIHLA